MDWIQVLVMIGSNVTIMLGIIGMSIQMNLHMDKKIDEHRKEANEILRAIHQEMKDFHGRLCDLEARRK